MFLPSLCSPETIVCSEEHRVLRQEDMSESVIMTYMIYMIISSDTNASCNEHKKVGRVLFDNIKNHLISIK